jgi:hypothetical protein
LKVEAQLCLHSKEMEDNTVKVTAKQAKVYKGIAFSILFASACLQI